MGLSTQSTHMYHTRKMIDSRIWQFLAEKMHGNLLYKRRFTRKWWDGPKLSSRTQWYFVLLRLRPNHASRSLCLVQIYAQHSRCRKRTRPCRNRCLHLSPSTATHAVHQFRMSGRATLKLPQCREKEKVKLPCPRWTRSRERNIKELPAHTLTCRPQKNFSKSSNLS